MKQNVKEKLLDKSRKMIDLVYDEVENGGNKEIATSFIDKKTGLKYKLSMLLEVTNPVDEAQLTFDDISEVEDEF